MSSRWAQLQAHCHGNYHPRMPREPKAGSFVIADMQVDPVDERLYRAIDHSTAAPPVFSVAFQLEQPKFFVRLTVATTTGKPIVTQLDVTPGWREKDGSVTGGAEGVTTTNLRQLLIDRLVRTALDAVRRPVEWVDEEGVRRLIMSGFSREEAIALNRASYRVPGATPPGVLRIDGGPARLTGRGGQTPLDRIQKAAELYRLAVERGSAAPVKEVGIALGYSTSQASRYLKTARERGLLDADEAVPER